MQATILFDLDDTLLDNDIDAFLPVYLKKLSDVMAAYTEPEHLVRSLLSATGQMVRNERPECTLKEVFDDAFFARVPVDRQVFAKAAERFYAEEYPKLEYVTKPAPGAVQVVEKLLERGHRVAVTTNPLFPRAAIVQRLQWAGLDPEQVPFALVTSYENFHFTKPAPAFYAEVLARLGWPEGPVVTVGDSLENDIVPSRQLGIRAFWTPSPRTEQARPAEGSLAPDGRGSLEDFLTWLETQPDESLAPAYGAREGMLATLRATPAVVHTWLAGLPAAAWAQKPAPDAWNLTEILCHLRDVDREVNLPRLERVMTEENPFITGMDTDQWATERNYARESGQRALTSFIAARMRLLSYLEALQPEDWQRPARHSILSRTHLSELVGIIASHDRLHLQQVGDTLQHVQSF